MRKIYLLILLLTIGVGASFAQKRVISGVVSDDTGDPIPGVNVFEKANPSNGVITNADGNYSITINDGNKSTIVYSFIGFENQEVVVGKKSKINIILVASVTGLDEVVVMGYGTQVRKNISGSVGKIDLTDISESAATENVASMLQGRMAGVNIQMNTGEPGATPVILIRGLGTLSREDQNAVSPPLFVIDGVPYITGEGGTSSSDALSDIDPNDIADITVLKDASSTAIYGSRAINGVIMITTKRGKRGRPEIRFNGKFGVNVPGQMRNTAGGALERMLKVDLYDKYNPDLELPLELADSLNAYWNNSTNWQDEVYQLSNYQNYTFSIRGAGDFGNYSLSLGHLNNVGIVTNTGYKRTNLRLNNTILTLKDRLSINAVVNITSTDRSRRVSVAEPSLGTSLAPSSNSSIYNGLDELGETTNGNVDNRFLGNLNFTLNIIKGVTFKSSLSANYGRGVANTHYPWEIVKDNGSITYSNYNSESESMHLIMDNTITYAGSFKKHHIAFLLGTSMEHYESELQSIYNDRREAFTQIVNWPQSIVNGGSSYGAYGMGSYFSRINYSFLERYLFSGSIRADGSSKFGEDNKWGTFPAASVGWIISNESFLENLSFLTMAKFRLSWGLSGGQFSDNYLAQGILQGAPNYGGGVGFTPLWYNGFRNKDLTWEQSEMWDVGFDLDILNGRIDIQMDYYKKETSGLLMTIDLANTSGYEKVYSNAADVVNEGFEFAINTTNIQKPQFRWETNFNFATNKNYVSGIVGGDEDIVRTSGSILRVGLPANGMFFYKAVGIIQGIDEVPVNPTTGKPLTGIGGEFLDVGDKLYEDINGDYIIDYRDRVYAGDPVPNVIGGFNNNFYWKNWYSYISTSFLIGRDVVNSALLSSFNSSVSGAIPDFRMYEIWDYPGDASLYPSINPWNERSQIIYDDTDYLEDGSYFKINSITLGYNFTLSQLRRLKLRQLKIYSTVANIATFQSYSGPDAEMVSSSGFDNSGGYPAPTTFILGLTIGF